MTPVPVTLPPGIFRVGTQYMATGRWYDGNFIRWHETDIHPIGGWEPRQFIGITTTPTLILDFENGEYSYDSAFAPDAGVQTDNGFQIPADPTAEIVRDIFSWQDNSGEAHTVFGSGLNLYRMSQANELTVITPAVFTGGIIDPSQAVGYGYCPYGSFSYNGTCPVPEELPAVDVWRWCFDAYGQDLIATGWLNRGPIYTWSPTAGGLATVIPGAPADVRGAVVTDQRMVMAIGSAEEGRLVRWCDRENFSDWTPAYENTAGSYYIQGNGQLVAIFKVLNQILILSENDAHVARFTGGPYFYRFDRVGDKCGPIHPSAVVVTDRFAIWLGDRAVWMYDGTLKKVQCELLDFLDDKMLRSSWSKIVGATVKKFDEIWWLYQGKTIADTEVGKYAVFNTSRSFWNIGDFTTEGTTRTAMYDANVLEEVLMVSANGIVYNHEQKTIPVNNAFVESGPFELGYGRANLAVSHVLPDALDASGGTVTLMAKQMPSLTEYSYGPYAYTSPMDTRAMGREMRMRWDGDDNTIWTFGTFRLGVVNVDTGQR